MKDARMTVGRKEDDEEASLTRELPHFRRSEKKYALWYFLQFLSLVRCKSATHLPTPTCLLAPTNYHFPPLSFLSFVLR